MAMHLENPLDFQRFALTTHRTQSALSSSGGHSQLDLQLKNCLALRELSACAVGKSWFHKVGQVVVAFDRVGVSGDGFRMIRRYGSVVRVEEQSRGAVIGTVVDLMSGYDDARFF